MMLMIIRLMILVWVIDECCKVINILVVIGYEVIVDDIVSCFVS